MKNIHLLPTDKPSRLFKFANELHLDTIPKDYYKKYILYITSDEEIKDDWCYDEYNKVLFKNTGPGTPGASKKIILTTDQELIADGVQSIDDKFLKWFVENPSCESVEIKLVEFEVDMGLGDECIEHSSYYKIIIPQGESKQECCREVGGFYLGTTCPNCKKPFRSVLQKEPKQETLEEAALEYASEKLRRIVFIYKELDANVAEYVGFINGAKWQAERMYSEEEVFKLICNFNYDLQIDEVKDIKKWFEQNKKK